MLPARCWPLPAGATVLDIGCACTTRRAAPRTCGRTSFTWAWTWGSTTCPKPITVLPTSWRSCRWMGAQYSCTRFRGRRFDLIYLKHVIEHTQQHQEPLTVLEGLLADHGRSIPVVSQRSLDQLPLGREYAQLLRRPRPCLDPERARNPQPAGIRAAAAGAGTASLPPSAVCRGRRAAVVAAACGLALAAAAALWLAVVVALRVRDHPGAAEDRGRRPERPGGSGPWPPVSFKRPRRPTDSCTPAASPSNSAGSPGRCPRWTAVPSSRRRAGRPCGSLSIEPFRDVIGGDSAPAVLGSRRVG